MTVILVDIIDNHECKCSLQITMPHSMTASLFGARDGSEEAGATVKFATVIECFPSRSPSSLIEVEFTARKHAVEFLTFTKYFGQRCYQQSQFDGGYAANKMKRSRDDRKT